MRAKRASQRPQLHARRAAIRAGEVVTVYFEPARAPPWPASSVAAAAHTRARIPRPQGVTRVRTLVVGTSNPGKVKEIEALLLRLPIVLRLLPGGLAAPPETAGTLEGNAALKAAHYARLTGEHVLADDTGLEVDALGGAPGVDTAVYAGPEADAAKNRAKLLLALRGIPPGGRTARFRCVVALARPSGDAAGSAEGVLEGVVTTTERGEHGFGYDPIFAPKVDGAAERTLAELPFDEKNALSHRARALTALRPKLLELLA
jgi:XTP/dITP diphosphohydrolase